MSQEAIMREFASLCGIVGRLLDKIESRLDKLEQRNEDAARELTRMLWRKGPPPKAGEGSCVCRDRKGRYSIWYWAIDGNLYQYVGDHHLQDLVAWFPFVDPLED